MIRFGVITDIHYCDKANQTSDSLVNSRREPARYYSGGLGKAEAFALTQRDSGSAFAIQLGDLIDDPADPDLCFEERRCATLGFVDAVETKLALFEGPRHNVFGNHDLRHLGKEDIGSRLANFGSDLPAGQYYYSWDACGAHFVVLDATYTSEENPYSGRPGAPGANFSWEDSNLPIAELEWIEADLASTALPTIVFTHQLLNPQDRIEADFDSSLIIRQAVTLRAILENSGLVLATFSGHSHTGGYQLVNGIHYVVLKGNVVSGEDATDHNQFATVELNEDREHGYRLRVEGNGGQESYDLKARLPAMCRLPSGPRTRCPEGDDC